MIGVGISTVEVALRGPGGTGLPSPGTGGSEVSDFAISAPATITEGNSGTKSVVFTVTRSGFVAGAGTVQWARSGTADTTDLPGAASSGTLAFAAGDLTKTITFTLQGDTTSEPDETIIVTLSNPSTTGTISQASATTTITNDDASAPTLPAQANIAARWSASSLPVVADGTTVSSWTDMVGGLVAPAAGGASTYKAAFGGGKPGVHFAGGRFVIGTPSSLSFLQSNTYNWSITIVLKNPTVASDFAVMFGDGNYGPGLWLGHDLAHGLSGPNFQITNPTPSQVTTVTLSGGWLFLNGVRFAIVGETWTAGNSLGIGDYGSGGLPFGGDISEVIIRNASLTAPQVLQEHLWACSQFGQASPLTGLTRFVVFDGDSQMYGIGAENTSTASGVNFAPPHVIARSKGWALGGYGAVGKPGAAMDGRDVGSNNLPFHAPDDVDGYAAVTGLPVTVCWFEWYNTFNSSAYTLHKNYGAARRTAIPGVRLVAGTSLDSHDRSGALRDSFNAAMVANADGAFDAVIPLHTLPHEGVNGACPTVSPYSNTYFADGVHFTQAGYSEIAAMIAGYL